MKIKKIKLINFKNFDLFETGFKDTNLLKGKNGCGKTSIRDAILFVLYNQTNTGGKDTDRFIKKGLDYCEVILTTEEYVYSRKRSHVGTELKLDDNIIKQQDLDLPPFEIFSSVFNVGYFNKLSEKDQRNLILKNTKEVNSLKLFLLADGDPDLIKQYKLDTDNISDCIKKINSEKLKITKNIDGANAILKYLTNIKPPSKIYTRDFIPYLIKEKENLTKERDSKLLVKKELDQCYKALNQIPILEMKQKSSNLLRQLRKEFKNVKLILNEPYKSGMADKDIFKFEVNDIYYENLSSGEKLRFDLVVSKFFNSLLAKSIDLYFIDEASVLDEDLKSPIQSFITQISPYDLEIIE